MLFKSRDNTGYSRFTKAHSSAPKKMVQLFLKKSTPHFQRIWCQEETQACLIIFACKRVVHIFHNINVLLISLYLSVSFCLFWKVVWLSVIAQLLFLMIISSSMQHFFFSFVLTIIKICRMVIGQSVCYYFYVYKYC